MGTGIAQCLSMNPRLKWRPTRCLIPGALRHLVIGNTGRLLVPRRMPITIVEIRLDTGIFVVRIEDFEDLGALWQQPFEDVRDYQFRCGSPEALVVDLREYERAVKRFDRQLVIECEASAARATGERLARERDVASRWLAAHSTFLAGAAKLPSATTNR